MDSCSDDVCHGGTDESLAQFHRGRRTVSRGIFRTIQQSSCNPPSVSGLSAFLSSVITAAHRDACVSTIRGHLRRLPVFEKKQLGQHHTPDPSHGIRCHSLSTGLTCSSLGSKPPGLHKLGGKGHCGGRDVDDNKEGCFDDEEMEGEEASDEAALRYSNLEESIKADTAASDGPLSDVRKRPPEEQINLAGLNERIIPGPLTFSPLFVAHKPDFFLAKVSSTDYKLDCIRITLIYSGQVFGSTWTI
ncbi:unnamed protein product [Protopolystoma xenopodis]|uniref:Uncharacterized protein n=1 Tax=Protopolystoma xenopodis TaxID=117903 RepID=A0A3S5B5L9_9PLAT|nr:unnamed protein product [Protopolystoma xenopodis]